MKEMRDLVSHSYGRMNCEIIWRTAINDIPVLKRFCEEWLTDDWTNKSSDRED